MLHDDKVRNLKEEEANRKRNRLLRKWQKNHLRLSKKSCQYKSVDEDLIGLFIQQSDIK